MFLDDDKTMGYVRRLTKDPSDETIKTVISVIQKLLPDEFSVDAELELIIMAAEPVHPGIRDRLTMGQRIS